MFWMGVLVGATAGPMLSVVVLLILRGVPTLPMEDCELASHMVQRFGRRPRVNRHRPAAPPVLSLCVGTLALAVILAVLTVLCLTF